jgi:hypothetical protein
MLIFSHQIGMQRRALLFGALSSCHVFSNRRHHTTVWGQHNPALPLFFFKGVGGRESDQGPKVQLPSCPHICTQEGQG